VGALYLVTYPHATRAKDTTIVVRNKARMRSVDFEFLIQIRHPDVRHPLALRHRLKLAMAIRDTHCAHMVALGEKKLENHTAILAQALAVGNNLHILVNARNACRQEFVHAFDFHQTHAASPDWCKARQVT
jgi:hypothetical protein